MIGTNTRHHAMMPIPYGLFNTVPQNLANCNIMVLNLARDPNCGDMIWDASTHYLILEVSTSTLNFRVST